MLYDQRPEGQHRAGAQWNITGKLSDTRFLTISPRYEVSFFDFSGATSLSPSGDVLDTGHLLSVTALHTTIIDDTWSWILGGVIMLGFEDGADAGDALTGAGFVAARQQYNKNFAWILGVGAVSRLEDDALIFPYFGIDWAINETLRLSSEGTSIRLDATLEDDLLLYSALGWTTREFRLDDSNTVAGGAFQENIWSWSLGVESKQLDMWRIRVEAGIILAHRMEVFNSGGASVGIADADPVGYIGFQVNRHF